MYRCLKWIEVKIWLYKEEFKIDEDELLIFYMLGYNFIEVLLDCVLNEFFSKIK